MRMQRLWLVFLAFVGLAALGGSARADETDIVPTSHAFGDRVLGVNTPTTTFNIEFTDTASMNTLTVGSVTSSGAGCGDYTLNPPSGHASYTGIADGTPLVVTVTFTPSTTGARPCTFTINDTVPNDGNADTFTVTGNGTGAVLTPNPAGTLAIGSVEIGGTTVSDDILVTNTGNTVLNVTNVVISGADSNSFVLDTATSFSVGAGLNTTVTVTCDPEAADGTGVKSALLTFTDNSVGPATDHEVNLSCTATQATILLNPALTLAIGSVRTGSTGNASVTVDNTGTHDLTVTQMVIGGTNPSNFQFNDHGCTAGSGTTCNPSPAFVVTPAEAAEAVNIVCVPGSNLGSLSATLTFHTNSSTGATTQINLTCTGVQPMLVLNPTDTIPFGSIHMGSTSGSSQLGVSNSGGFLLTVTGLTITGTNSTAFRFNGGVGCNTQTCSGFTVAAFGGPTNVPIVCIPGLADRGSLAATVNVANDSTAPDTQVGLTCTGTSPVMTETAVGGGALADPIVCGTVPVNGGSSTCTFQINNGGASNETLDWTVTSNTPGEYLVSAGGAPAVSVSGTTVTGATTTVITVTFNPTAGGTRGGTITVSGDDANNPSDTLNFTGNGTVPTIQNIVPVGLTVTLANTDITTAPATTSTASTISLQNAAGGAPLQITSVALTGGQAAQFAIATGSTGSHALAAGATDTWTVTCTPVAPAGLKTTTFRVTHDSPGGVPGQQLNFTLNCTGLLADLTVTGALAFGSVLEMTTANDSVTITNSSTNSRTVSLTSVTSPFGVYVPTFNPGGASATIAPGASVNLDVAFTPINGATSNGNFTVAVGTAATVEFPSFTIPVTGDGIHEGFDITITGEADPSAINLGDRRVLTPVARFVQMQNSSDVPINISSVTSNDSECALSTFVPGNPPINNLAAGGIATFTINVTPDHIGGGTCTISMNGLIPSTSAVLSEMIVVTWNGVAPEVTLLAPTAGAALDFVGVDVDSAPVQLPVQLQNSGEFLLTITGCSISGPQAARFSVGSCATTVTPGGDVIFMVTYDPTLEALDGALLTLNTDSFPVGTVTVDLEGVGLDQHINLPALSYTFPDTFRNPDEGPVQMVIVEDPLDATTGQAAPLTISMAVTDASVDDVFVLPDAGPFTVDPGDDVGIAVEFRPTAYATFSGVITIFNDTTGNPMAQVQVTGNGISRNVTVSPGDIDLGITGVNIPIRLSDIQEGGIQISNIDPDNIAYTVQSLALVDAAGNVLDPEDTPFSLEADDGLVLAADGTLNYDAEFAPTEEGEYEVTVAVFLDNDPEAHALVTLHGVAVEVELRGGGCQAGGDPSTGGLVVMALGLLALPWRRRKTALMAAAVVLALVGIASADPTRNVDLATFSPAPATEVGTFAVESAEVGVNGAWALDLMFSHATNLLMVTSPSAAAMGMEPDTPVSARSSVQLGFAYAFMDRFEAGLRVPVYQQTGTAPQFSGLAPADGTALGDVAAHGKANLVSTDSISFGASLDLSVPTATDGEFAGVDGPSGQLRALVGWRAHRFGVNVNAGFLGRKTGELGNISQGSAVTFGGGAWFRALDAMYVIGESFGSAGLGGGVKQAEGVLGVRYEVARSIGVSVGAGRGLVHGVGSPDLRGFLLLDIAPKARESAPLVIIKPKPPRDTRDDDNDGVVNADDQCADPEDLDGFQDDDGCPEVDNDEDAIPDSEDKCPLEPEDPDGYLDEDGCADTDNDGDGILDLDDKCPGEAEDKDGYMDSDGCDEVDNDSDGIPDVIDQCALEQETINGNNDDDGCPDNGDSLVMVMPDRIEIFEPVAFTGTTSTLSKKSANILGQVAATMRANRDFKRLRVTVHVHPRDGEDQALSDKRAKVVRDWLVQWGIEPERVESRGLGSTRPLVPKKQKGAAALNDRVEFIILEKEDVSPATP